MQSTWRTLTPTPSYNPSSLTCLLDCLSLCQKPTLGQSLSQRQLWQLELRLLWLLRDFHPESYQNQHLLRSQRLQRVLGSLAVSDALASLASGR